MHTKKEDVPSAEQGAHSTGRFRQQQEEVLLLRLVAHFSIFRPGQQCQEGTPQITFCFWSRLHRSWNE